MEDHRVNYFFSRNMNTDVRMTPRPAKTPAWSICPTLDDPSSCSDNASDNSDKLDFNAQTTVSLTQGTNHTPASGPGICQANGGMLGTSVTYPNASTSMSTISGGIHNNQDCSGSQANFFGGSFAANNRKRKIIGSGIGASFVTTSSTSTMSSADRHSHNHLRDHHHHHQVPYSQNSSTSSSTTHTTCTNSFSSTTLESKFDANGISKETSSTTGACMSESKAFGSFPTGSFWADAESLAADFDGSLSGLGADLSSSSYDMSEALLALPSLYNRTTTTSNSYSHLHQHHANNSAAMPSGTKEENLTPLGASNGHGGSSVSLPGDFQFENFVSPPAQSSELANSKQNHGSVQGKSKQHCSGNSNVHLDCERRFQYVLAAATSICTKVNEETLTYLNQGQPYEIKLKKLGELTAYRGTVFKSVVKLCFHDRRLQFTEREQLSQWEVTHPSDRILQVDLPLSYGVTMLSQSFDASTNVVSFLWEPLKEVGLYIKVNCISTEFTQKKHGGEKGVPFRLLIETYSHSDNVRLHAAACQIKVFKLKGADRKHKQDREKILKKSAGEQSKLQPSYECTVLTDISLDSLDSPIGQSQNQNMSPSCQVDNCSITDSPEIDYNKLASHETNGTGISSVATYGSFCPTFSSEHVRRWLQRNRFSSTKALWDFNGFDLLRLSKDELIEICGLAEGIRLFNALHYKITFYCSLTNADETKLERFDASPTTSIGSTDHEPIFHPICLSSHCLAEFISTLANLYCQQYPSDPRPVERLLLVVNPYSSNGPGLNGNSISSNQGSNHSSRLRVLINESLLTTLKDTCAFKAVKKASDVFLEQLLE